MGRAQGRAPLQVRVGVNTGEVVVRSIHTGEHAEYTPVGHSTGLAARMQALAPIGSIAVTAATQRLCAGYFALRALGPARVKGVSEPIEVFEVTGLGPLRTRLEAASRRGFTRFVGRVQELAQLRRAFHPRAGSMKPLERVMELGQVSARGADKIIRVAWSLADLGGRDRPGVDEVGLAIGLWLGVTQ